MAVIHLFITDENDVEVDVIDDVVIADAWFQSLSNGKPGSCSFRIKHRASGSSPVNPRFPDIGARIRLTIDGENEWRGFVMRRDYEYAFPVEDTTDYRQTITRFLVVEGMDYNLLFSRRYVFDQADPTKEIPLFPQGMTDQDMIAELFASYVDLSGLGLDLTSGVTNVGIPGIYEDFKACGLGDTLGQALNIISLNLGAIFYFDLDNVFRWVDDETTTAPYPLSDAPTGGAKGYRDLHIISTAERLCNDMTVRGAGVGSPEMVVSRKIDADSVAIHGVFQEAELHNDMYKQLTADRRANTYVLGSPQNRRGHNKDWDTVVCTVFEQGFHVGQVVDFESQVHGWSDNIPVRECRVTFPTHNAARWELSLSHDIDPGLTYADWPGPTNKNQRHLPWGEDVPCVPAAPTVFGPPMTPDTYGLWDEWGEWRDVNYDPDPGHEPTWAHGEYVTYEAPVDPYGRWREMYSSDVVADVPGTGNPLGFPNNPPPDIEYIAHALFTGLQYATGYDPDTDPAGTCTYTTSHPFVAATLKGSVDGDSLEKDVELFEGADLHSFTLDGDHAGADMVSVVYFRSDSYENGPDDPGYYEDPGADQFDPGGGGAGDWRWPCSGIITQDYGCTAFGGANGYAYGDGCPTSAPYWHDGIDIANGTGTPLRAPDDAIVNYVGWNSTDADPAFIVILDLDGGYQVGLAHLLPIYKVRAGQVVLRGELVGYMGNTGNSTGTHTHFEARYNGQEFNPRAKLVGGP